MEKRKTQLQKVKAEYLGGKRQSDARSLNRQFTEDTRQVYTKFETCASLKHVHTCARAKISDLGIRKIQTTVPMEMVATPLRILRRAVFCGRARGS